MFDYFSAMKYICILFISFVIYSCSKPDVCNTSTTWNAQCVFYTLDSKSADSLIALDSIDVKGLTISTFLYDTALAKKSVALPLDISTDTSRYVLGRKKTFDTLTIAYRTEPTFISKACGYGYKQELLSITSTHHLIKSVAVTSASIEKNATENIKIYY